MRRLWNHLSTIPEGRTAKTVFNWVKAPNYQWCSEINPVFSEADRQHIFTSCPQCRVQFVKQKLFLDYKEKWAKDIWHNPKLRTYCQIKNVYSPEPYVTLPMRRSRRSLCAQLRTGILPLAIEVGRFNSVAEEERLCTVCDLSVIEDELHFLFHCPMYDEPRKFLSEEMQNRRPEFFWSGDEVKLEWLFREKVFTVASFIKRAWKLRITDYLCEFDLS